MNKFKTTKQQDTENRNRDPKNEKENYSMEKKELNKKKEFVDKKEFESRLSLLEAKTKSIENYQEKLDVDSQMTNLRLSFLCEIIDRKEMDEGLKELKEKKKQLLTKAEG